MKKRALPGTGMFKMASKAGPSAAARSIAPRLPGGTARRLTLWAVLCATCVVAIHVLARDFGSRIGSYRSGAATLGVFLLASTYSARKRMLWLSVRWLRLAMRLPRPIAHRLILIDRLESWRWFHVMAGVGVILPFWWHIEQGGASRLEAALAASIVLLTLSGLAGAVIQDFLPAAMRVRPGQEVRLEDVEAALHELYVEAEEAILGHHEDLVRTYLATIRPILLGTQSRFTMFWATLTSADPAGPVGGRLRAQADAPQAEAWDRLVGIAERKVRLEHNRFNLLLGTNWLKVHIGLAVLSSVLIAFHIAGVLYFSGL